MSLHPGFPSHSPHYDAEGRRTDGEWLLYSEYINVEAILSAQRIPEDVPKGRTRAEWPTWPEIEAPEGGHRCWSPGDPWPKAWPHDEHLFIVTHQAFELWFKQALLDLDDVMDEASAVGERYGLAIPRADLRPPEGFRTLTPSILKLYPGLLRATNVLDDQEKGWLYEMPVPGGARTPSRLWDLSSIDSPTLARWTARMVRATKILDHATGAFDILATMPPHAFLEFRGRLTPASGFGSSQFRELEILAGLGGARGAMAAPPQGAALEGLRAVTEPSASTPRGAAEQALARHLPYPELSRIDRRMRSPSLRDLVGLLLQSPELCGQDDAELRQRVDEVASSNVAALHQEYRREALHPQGDLGIRMSNRWREIGRLLAPPEHIGLSWLYRNPDRHPALVALLDACFGFDECLTRWRHVHVAFVERMIGARPGTGGGGVEYLRRTLELPSAFPWLKDFRTILMASLSY